MRGVVPGLALLIPCTGFVLAQEVPRADLFLGYSFQRVNSAQTIPAFTANGGLGTLGLNLNDHFGFEIEFGGYHNGNINDHHFDTTTLTYLVGPRVSLGRSRRIDPYLHILFGGEHATTSIFVPPQPVVNPLSSGVGEGGRWKATQDNFAMAVGGGLDVKLGHVVSLRPIQFDYLLTRFETPDLNDLTGPTHNRNQHNLRYAAGLQFNFGGEKAEVIPPPVMKSCPDGTSVPAAQECPKQTMSIDVHSSQAQVCPGATVTVSPSGTLPGNASLQWTVNGEAVNQAPALEFGTNGRAPGAYHIGLKVAAPGFNDASAETTVNVMAYQPPTGTASASPAEISAGDKSTLSANFTPGQCGGQLQPPTFTASEGAVNGAEFDSSTVAFDPADKSEQRKTITITAKVADGQGSGSADTQIVVRKKAEVVAQRLPDLVFPANSARVNNCGKRVLLEQLKTLTDADATGTVVFIGHQGGSETADGLDMKRALNAAAVISAGNGICTSFPAAQIQVGGAGTDQSTEFQPHFCETSTETPERAGQSVAPSDETAKFRRVEVWFTPTNGNPPPSLKERRDAASAGVAALGCPR